MESSPRGPLVEPRTAARRVTAAARRATGVLGGATLLTLALLVVAEPAGAAAARYGTRGAVLTTRGASLASAPSRNVVATPRGATLASARSLPRPARADDDERSPRGERVRPDEPWRTRDLPFVAGRDLGQRERIGTAVRSPLRSLATRTVLLQRPLRDLSARPLRQRAAACRASASQSHPLRAPPSLAL